MYRLHQEELDAIEDEHLRYDRLVELNVQEQCLNVIKMACVQERYLLDGYPIVHGWVFDLRTGRLYRFEHRFQKHPRRHPENLRPHRFRMGGQRAQESGLIARRPSENIAWKNAAFPAQAGIRSDDKQYL